MNPRTLSVLRSQFDWQPRFSWAPKRESDGGRGLGTRVDRLDEDPWAGSEVFRSSGIVTDPHTGEAVCTSFTPEVRPSSGTSGFANLLPYMANDTGVRGTVVRYQGEYSTNVVSTSGATTTTLYSAAWNFKHN